MKKQIYAFIFFLLTTSSYSQVNLDSLMGIWNDKTKADTSRLNAMDIFLHGGPNREFQGNDLFITNLDSTLILIKQMQTLAKGYPRQELKAVRLNGAYFQTIQNFPEAMNFYGQALKIAKETKDPRLIMLSLVTLGNGEFAWGVSTGIPDSSNFVQAEKYFLEALNLMELQSINSNEVATKRDAQLTRYGAYAYKGLGLLSEAVQNFPNARGHYENSILLATEIEDVDLLEEALGRLGMAFDAERNYPAAIRFYTKSLHLAEQKGDNHWIAHNLQSLGELYTRVGEYSKAEDYLARALASMQAAGAFFKREQLPIFLSLHNCYSEQKNYTKALENDAIFIKMAREIFPPFVGIGYALLASDYYELGDYTKALEYGFLGLKTNETGYLHNFISVQIGNAYRKQGQYIKAITWCEKANTDPNIELQKDACECLYESHKALKHGNEALAYHEKFLLLNDSLNTQELSKNLQQMEFAKQVLTDSIAQVEKERLVEETHIEEIRQSTQTRNILIGLGIVVLLFSVGLWSRLRYIRKSKAVLQVEKDRSENLLLNILPAEIAEELKATGRAEARDFDKVSILFTDFKEFTQTSAKLTAKELVGEINFCFEAFDKICGKYNVEKIKTIGDAYMAAGGLPVPTHDSAKNTVLAVLEMQRFIADRKAAQDAMGKPAFEMRVGVHTGPVVAGIVGVKKFQYDIWGDTVNTASRMESNGEVGRVNISQSTYEELKDNSNFTFEKREKVHVKGKGEMEMYFVS